MAIQFLNTVDLNFNQLNKAAIQNIPTTDPIIGVLGQLIYNVGAGAIKVCTTASSTGPTVNAVFSEVGGGVISLTINDGTYIDVNSTGTATNPVFAPDLNAVDGTSDLTTRFLSKDNTWDVVTHPASAVTSVGPDTAINRIGITTDQTTGVVLVGLDIEQDSNLLGSEPAGDDILLIYDKSTTKNKGIEVQELVKAAPQGTLTGIDAGDYIRIDDDATATPEVNVIAADTDAGIVAGTSASKVVALDGDQFGYVAKPASGDSTNKIATTSFVQEAVVGNLQFKGGFRASTGAIDPAPTPATFLYQLTGGSFDASKARLAIAVGDYYVVTVAGNFFGNSATPLTPGDSVIAQKAALANASVEADFIVVQSDTDLATYATVGLGNVNVQTEAAGSAITAGYVGQATGLAAGGIIEIDYATDPGTAALSVRESTAAALGVVTVEGGSGIDVTYTDGVASIAIDASASPSTKLVDLNDADAAVERTFANGITTYDLEVDNTDVFGAGVLSANVIAEVQVKNASIFTGASVGMTVYAEITRTVTDEIKFSFAGDSTDNSYKVWLTRMA